MLVVLLGACAHTRPAGDGEGSQGEGSSLIELNGRRTAVRWNDGDSFTFLDGPYVGKGVRMRGFNTLESYGPVHRWGDWTAQELYAIAKDSRDVAAGGHWDCTTEGKLDSYKRVLVTCPDAAEKLIREGWAHVYAFKEEADPTLLEAQRDARAAQVGMWAKGRPEWLVTNLHPASSGRGRDSVISTRTGQWAQWPHEKEYAVCQEVCVDHPVRGSCMLYVPYERRYRDRPDCIEPRP